MSDTPRTDAASRMAFSGEYMVPIQDAQKLERDLAQSKEANAGLMRACDKYESELAEELKEKKFHHDWATTYMWERNCARRELAEARRQRDTLEEAAKILAEEYENRRVQWGSEYLWTKHEDADAVNNAILTIRKSYE